MPPLEKPPEPTPSLGFVAAATAQPSLLPPPLPAVRPSAGAPVCANCGTALSGPFCAICGQHVADFHRSVWRLLGELSDNLFCWDNKFLLTLGPLLTQPGILTREFMSGRRVRYVQPLRLFLFVGAVCLSLLQLDRDWLQLRFDPAGKKHKTHAAAAAQPGPAATAPINGTPDPAAAAPAPPSPAATSPGDGTPDWAAATRSGKSAGDAADDTFDHQIDRAIARKAATPLGESGVRQEITANVQRKFSWVALALLPFFALMLRAVYWRHDTFYFLHLIFSLHYHTFLLLFWTAFIGCKWLLSSTFLLRWLIPFSWLLLLLPAVYLFLALRQVYGGGPKVTLAKTLVVGTIHLFTLIGGVAAVGLLAVLT